MHIQDLILLVIGSEHEKKLHGRATLQKKLYFLSALKKTDLGFGPHYYGPYSSSVAHNLDILVNCRFLREITESYSRDRSVLGEFRRHTYFWSDDSETVMNEIKQENGYAEWEEALGMLIATPWRVISTRSQSRRKPIILPTGKEKPLPNKFGKPLSDMTGISMSRGFRMCCHFLKRFR